MADIKLDTLNYDVVICGTSLTEVILASACSRVGKNVLIFDASQHYGGAMTSLAARDITKFAATGVLEGHVRERSIPSESDLELWRNLVGSGAEACAFTDGACPSPFSDVCLWTPEPSAEEAKAEAAGGQADTTEAASSSENKEGDLPAGDSESLATSSTTGTIEASATPDPAPATPDATLDPALATTTPDTAPAIAPATAAAPASTPDIAAAPAVPSLQSLPRARDYVIDLTPKVMFSKGPLVELLIRANVQKYLQLRALDDCFLIVDRDRGLYKTPLSKSSVFQDDLLSLLDKRSLMKFLHIILGNERSPEDHKASDAELQGFSSRPWTEFLAHKHISPLLSSIINYAIAVIEPAEDVSAMTTVEGVRRTKQFLGSLGRYSPGPFLFSMYGASELPQAFVRVCAVNGGTVILHFAPSCFVLTKDDPSVALGLVTQANQFVTAIHLFVQAGWLPSPVVQSALASRAVLVLDGPLNLSATSKKTTDGLSVITIPPGKLGNTHVVRALELDSSVHVAAQGNVLLHLYTLSEHKSAQDDLMPVISALLGNNTSRIVWGMFYKQTVFTAPLPPAPASPPSDSTPASPSAPSDATPATPPSAPSDAAASEVSAGEASSAPSATSPESPAPPADPATEPAETPSSPASPVALTADSAPRAKIVYISNSPLSFSFEESAVEAEKLFRSIYPDLPFLAQDNSRDDENDEVEALPELDAFEAAAAKMHFGDADLDLISEDAPTSAAAESESNKGDSENNNSSSSSSENGSGSEDGGESGGDNAGSAAGVEGGPSASDGAASEQSLLDDLASLNDL